MGEEKERTPPQLHRTGLAVYDGESQFMLCGGREGEIEGTNPFL